jgi:hypothetical protein
MYRVTAGKAAGQIRVGPPPCSTSVNRQMTFELFDHESFDQMR